MAKNFVTEKLKTCPHCGGNVSLKKFNGDKLTYDYEVWCDKCGLQATFGVGYKGVGAKETIEAWNRREG